MTALHTNPLFARLAGAERILVAGAGGGFDIYSGLPVALSLLHQGKEVHLANLSFSTLAGLPAGDWAAPDLAAVTPDSAPHLSYCPERTLARWLRLHGYPSTVYAFPQVGVQPLRAAYRALIDLHRIDAVVLVDGGTDILMRGDEAGLGTPEEDLTSVAALAALDDVPERLVVSVGFGVDAYHGVSHALVLENIAALQRDGAYLGAFSIPRATREGALFLDAVAHAQEHTPDRPSIVAGSIAAAVRGAFGDVRFTERTSGSELFVNPLMSLCFAFELRGLADRCLYLDLIEDTHLMRQVHSRIAEFREDLVTRPSRAIPH
ncbi:DUF1152 domain-containing protein [Streptomyces lavendulae]|uniref:DUF1152 domain-containing protein n=1 Tax=Streptomyces lavendulae TaxID=1914 RepID=UPI0024A07E9F|nr:DUF1152 domain-containing protein [Streptomyces lavendulae]GLX24052.1 hypothetical protein Slala01_76960 [Streptomyces lavendulae subsp. lavendulae]GLX27983.1 hypothetical protein Slala02_38030 [Streptomyces lavendulae subsp. lavendulae]